MARSRDIDSHIVDWNAIDAAAILDFRDGGNRLDKIIDRLDDDKQSDELEQGDGGTVAQQSASKHTDDA